MKERVSRVTKIGYAWPKKGQVRFYSGYIAIKGVELLLREAKRNGGKANFIILPNRKVRSKPPFNVFAIYTPRRTNRLVSKGIERRLFAPLPRKLG